MSKVFVIIVAGGSSYRFGKKDKLMVDLAGKPVIWHTLKAFEENENVTEIILVCSKNNIEELKPIAQRFSKNKKVIQGGTTRQDSSYLGLKSIKDADEKDVILIHNGANPLVTQQDIERVIEATRLYGAAVIGNPENSTLKKVNTEGFIEKTVDRNGLWRSETPQGIKYNLAMEAFAKAENEGYEATDDVELVEYYGHKVRMFEGSGLNLKITNPQDIETANLILNKPQKTYVGIGQDSHRFAGEPKPLMLGNYQISEKDGLEGNSDADVVIHALCNALSSAIGGHSLSRWSDEMCKNGITDSKFYLEKILQEVKNAGFQINNLSLALEGSKPKLEKHLPLIQARLSGILNLQKTKIGITVTSGEGLSDYGKGLGIQCFCFVSLGKLSSSV